MITSGKNLARSSFLGRTSRMYSMVGYFFVGLALYGFLCSVLLTTGGHGAMMGGLFAAMLSLPFLCCGFLIKRFALSKVPSSPLRRMIAAVGFLGFGVFL